MSQRPSSAAQGSVFSRASNHSMSQQKLSVANSTGRYPYGPAINAGSKARPTSSNPARTLHDKQFFWDTKMDKSASYFKNTRVQTCSHIVTKNGKTVAMQFPLEKTGWKAPTSYQNTARSSEVMSWS